MHITAHYYPYMEKLEENWILSLKTITEKGQWKKWHNFYLLLDHPPRDLVPPDCAQSPSYRTLYTVYIHIGKLCAVTSTTANVLLNGIFTDFKHFN